MTAGQLVELVGYTGGGILAASRGDALTAAKCFLLAATALVPQDVAQAHLSEAAINRQNMIADVDEVIKFGRLS